MAEWLSLATALADHPITAADTQRTLRAMLPPHSAARLSRIVEGARNETRYFVLPLEQVLRLDTLEARDRHYMQHAVRLGERVAREAIERAGVDPDTISAIIGVSSTGYLMPTLETHLLERLHLSPHCRRVPLTQLGCAGGAASLGLAAALSAAPSARVLVVSVELPSLSFPTVEPSPNDIVASTQFGDGAAAAVVCAGQHRRGPTVVATDSVVFPETIDNDGVQLTSMGLRLMRPRALADILRRNVGDVVDRFLGRHDLARRDVGFWVIHPRNPELLDAVGASLQLPDAALAASRTVWRRSGNVISAAVFHALEELAATAPPPSGTLGMMVAFGAGFGCELVLLRSAGWLSRRQGDGPSA